MAKTAQKEDKFDHAMDQAATQYESIQIMVADLERAQEQDRDGGADEIEAPRQRIEEDALSVQVRSGWHQPGTARQGRPLNTKYCFARGDLRSGSWGSSVTTVSPNRLAWSVRIFLPWTAWRGNCGAVEVTLLSYARCFYFGEG